MPIQIAESATYLKDLYCPETVGPIIGDKLIPNIVLAPLTKVNDTLVGQAGDTVTVPYYHAIGDADNVREGDRIPIAPMYQDFKQVKVKKIGKGALVTDEAILCGRSKPTLEILRQFAAGIASKVDNDLLDALDGVEESHIYRSESGELNPAELPLAAVRFGEETGEKMALIVDPLTFAALLDNKAYIPASELSAQKLIKGSVGMVYGMNILVSSRMTGRHAFYIVKPGALSLYLKRDVLVEADRDVMNQSTVLTISKIFAPYLYRPSKAVKFQLKLSYLVDEERERLKFGDTYIIIN